MQLALLLRGSQWDERGTSREQSSTKGGKRTKEKGEQGGRAMAGLG